MVESIGKNREKTLSKYNSPTGDASTKIGGIPPLFSRQIYFLRCRIRARIRRFFRPIFLRPRPVFLTPTDPPLRQHISKIAKESFIPFPRSGPSRLDSRTPGSSSLTVPWSMDKSKHRGLGSDSPTCNAYDASLGRVGKSPLGSIRCGSQVRPTIFMSASFLERLA